MRMELEEEVTPVVASTLPSHQLMLSLTVILLRLSGLRSLRSRRGRAEETRLTNLS